jgi:parallel beta-helix repeat protein
MITSAILLATTLCFGLASTILLSNYAFAQVIELPPFFPPEEPAPGNNGTNQVPEQTPGNSTSPPPAPPVEPPAEEPAGNESSAEPIIRPSVQSTNPCLEFDEGADDDGDEQPLRVRIVCDADIYELFAGLRDDSITQQLGSGQIQINANITVEEGATFRIHPDGGINYVKIADDNGITVLGAIHIDGVKITSWDSAANEVIEQKDDGATKRAYLFLSGSDGSHIRDSELGYMGYNATGHRGLDLMSNSTNFYISNSTFHNMWYGFYSNGAQNVTIASSEYYDNHQYAVDPHTSTYNMTIANNTVYNNPVGLVCSLDCYGIVFEGNTMYNNTGAGIFFSRNTHDSIARNNSIYDQQIGIAFSESADNRVYNNKIWSVGRAIFLNNPEVRDDGTTMNNRIYNNTISDSAVGIASLRSTDNIATNNFFHNISTAHYRLDGGSTLTIDNQNLTGATIEGRAGANAVTFANVTSVMIDGDSYDASLRHTMTLSNQTVMVSAAPRE